MTKKHDDRNALPAELRNAAEQLRRMEPSEDFDARLSKALVAADQEQYRKGAARPGRFARFGAAWLAVVPGAAGMALMLHMAFGNGTEEGADDMWHQVQSQEVELVLDADGHSWISLDLLTHHHEGQHAVVRVDAPHNVRVVASEHAEHHEDSPVCAAERCIHSFSQPTHADVSKPLQVGVAEPGRYRISGEHASPEGRVREEFVVHARR